MSGYRIIEGVRFGRTQLDPPGNSTPVRAGDHLVGTIWGRAYVGYYFKVNGEDRWEDIWPTLSRAKVAVKERLESGQGVML